MGARNRSLCVYINFSSRLLLVPTIGKTTDIHIHACCLDTCQQLAELILLKFTELLPLSSGSHWASTSDCSTRSVTNKSDASCHNLR